VKRVKVNMTLKCGHLYVFWQVKQRIRNKKNKGRKNKDKKTKIKKIKI